MVRIVHRRNRFGRRRVALEDQPALESADVTGKALARREVPRFDLPLQVRVKLQFLKNYFQKMLLFPFQSHVLQDR